MDKIDRSIKRKFAKLPANASDYDYQRIISTFTVPELIHILERFGGWGEDQEVIP